MAAGLPQRSNSKQGNKTFHALKKRKRALAAAGASQAGCPVCSAVLHYPCVGAAMNYQSLLRRGLALLPGGGCAMRARRRRAKPQRVSRLCCMQT